MQKRQANPKLPLKSLILIGSRQGTDGKSISNSASVRGRSSFCSVTTDTSSGCRLARGSPERGRRVVGYVTALSLPAQPEPPTQQDTTAQLPCAAPDCGFLRTWLGMRGFQNRTKMILDGIQLTPSTIFCSR